MTKTEFVEAMKEFQQVKDNGNEKNKIVDWLFKALIAVVVYLTIALSKNVDRVKQDMESVQKDISIIKTQRQYTQEEINNMKVFMTTDLYTEKDYQKNIEPIIKSIEMLNKKTDDMYDNSRKQERRIDELEYKLK